MILKVLNILVIGRLFKLDGEIESAVSTKDNNSIEPQSSFVQDELFEPILAHETEISVTGGPLSFEHLSNRATPCSIGTQKNHHYGKIQFHAFKFLDHLISLFFI